MFLPLRAPSKVQTVAFIWQFMFSWHDRKMKLYATYVYTDYPHEYMAYTYVLRKTVEVGWATIHRMIA